MTVISLIRSRFRAWWARYAVLGRWRSENSESYYYPYSLPSGGAVLPRRSRPQSFPRIHRPKANDNPIDYHNGSLFLVVPYVISLCAFYSS